jgi:hypothetical protein
VVCGVVWWWWWWRMVRWRATSCELPVTRNAASYSHSISAAGAGAGAAACCAAQAYLQPI